MKTIKNILLLLFLSSCTPEVNYPIETKSATETVTVINNAKNTSLNITDCNVGDIVPTVVEYGDTVQLCEVENKADTIVLNGNVSANGITLYKGPIHIPFNNTIKFSPVCNWVDTLGNKLIHPIEFDASVNEWKR